MNNSRIINYVMKKIILILGLMFIASPAMAMPLGWGSDIDCKVWREGDKTIDEAGFWQENFCKSAHEPTKRLYELEILVTKLESQISQLQATCNSQSIPVTGGDDLRVSALESRMSKVESVLNFLQTTVVQAFSTTIGLLQKLVK
jgi:hypothetical protein